MTYQRINFTKRNLSFEIYWKARRLIRKTQQDRIHY